MRGIFRDTLGEGNCESKIVARQWGVKPCREASKCLAGPFGEGPATPVNGGSGVATFKFMENFFKG